MPNTYQNMQGMQGLPVMQPQSQPMYNMNSNSNLNPDNQNKTLIKSITKELINNLKENNISLRDDNSSLNSSSSKTKSKSKSKSSKSSKNKYIDQDDYNEDLDDLDDLEDVDNLLDIDKDDISKTDKQDYKKIIKRNVENMMAENGVPESSNLTSYIFDDLFNIKEVALLFGLYFLLSQEMIKDLFAQYFTSLNPDDTGKVGVKGVIIYGLILTILFMVLKKVV